MSVCVERCLFPRKNMHKTQEQQIMVTENALLGETSSQQISGLVAWKLMIVIV